MATQPDPAPNRIDPRSPPETPVQPDDPPPPTSPDETPVVPPDIDEPGFAPDQAPGEIPPPPD